MRVKSEVEILEGNKVTFRIRDLEGGGSSWWNSLRRRNSKNEVLPTPPGDRPSLRLNLTDSRELQAQHQEKKTTTGCFPPLKKSVKKKNRKLKTFVGGAAAGALTVGATAPAVALELWGRGSRIAELESKVTELGLEHNRTIYGFWKDVHGLRIQNHRLEGLLEASQGKVQVLEESLGTANSKVQTLVSELADRTALLDTMGAALFDTQGALLESTDMVQSLMERLLVSQIQLKLLGDVLDEVVSTPKVVILQQTVDLQFIQQNFSFGSASTSSELTKFVDVVNSMIRQLQSDVEGGSLGAVAGKLQGLQQLESGASLEAVNSVLVELVEALESTVEAGLVALLQKSNGALQKVIAALVDAARNGAAAEGNLLGNLIAHSNALSESAELSDTLTLLSKVFVRLAAEEQVSRETVTQIVERVLAGDEALKLKFLKGGEEALKATNEALEEAVLEAWRRAGGGVVEEATMSQAVSMVSASAAPSSAPTCVAAPSVTKCVAVPSSTTAAAANVVLPSTQLTAANVLSALGAATLGAFKLFAAIL